MRLYYHQSDYISHRMAGEHYIECLKSLGHEIVGAPEAAQAAILHDEPPFLPGLFLRFPVLHEIPCAVYCVWEGDYLPKAYMDALGLADAIWTASKYSLAVFQQHFPGTELLPHVVKRGRPRPEDLQHIQRLIGYAPDRWYFYSILDAANPRKNVGALLTAFSALFPAQDRRVHLVIKQYRQDLPLPALPNVISLGGTFSPGQMAALHSLCHCYVSPHRAEAWGLALSEAMAFGRPVIATGYSGNMEFMSEENSFPLPYTLEPVPDSALNVLPFFEKGMRWAQVDNQALTLAMRRLAGQVVPPDLKANAARITKAFGPAAIAERLEALLDKLMLHGKIARLSCMYQ